MKTWFSNNWQALLNLVLAGLLVYFLSRDTGKVENTAQYKALEKQLQAVNAKLDTLNQVVASPIVEDAADSLILSKLDKTLYEINKMRKASAVRPDTMGSAALREYFHNLPK